MTPWRFSVYVTGHGKCVVEEDLGRLTDKGLEHFKAQVRYLAPASLDAWRKPKARKLAGAASALHEICFRNDNRETRAIGFFGPEADEFTITIVCSHKGTIYEPASALQTADDRRKYVIAGSASRAPLQFDGEDFPPLPE